MLKNAKYSEKYTMLKDFIPEIVLEVKKDLKNEHLSKDKAFLRQYFEGKAVARLTNEDLVAGYTKAFADEELENLREFVTTRWILKNTEIYQHFEMHLRSVAPTFTDLEILELKVAQEVKNKAIEAFGSVKSYIFSVLNSVVYPKEVFDEFAEQARKEQGKAREEKKLEIEERDLQVLQTKHERETRRLTDKYEKKLQGFQKKYDNDIASLKKQIRNLQQKLS
jgi:hypothetical protein